MKKYSVLLFDADGTLFDFDKAECYALEKSIIFFGRDFKTDIHLANYREINKKIWKDFEKGLITAEELLATLSRESDEYQPSYQINKLEELRKNLL